MNPEPRPWRVAVCTAHSPDYQPLADLTLPTVRTWCQKHGYDLFYKGDLDPKRGDRIKIEMFQSIYQQKTHDTYVWIDTDAAISNTDVRLENFCEWHDIDEKAHVIWGCDPAGPNSGFLVARFSPESYGYFSESLKRSAEMGWADQVGMIQMMLVHPWKQWVKTIDGKFCNAYPIEHYGWHGYPNINEWEPGCFVFHTPGMPMEKRIQVFQEYLPRFK